MIDLARNEARYIALLYRRLVKSLDRELTTLGLAHGRYVYLFGLYIEDGQSQQSLADRAGADKAATTRALARLEADGFIRRERDATDMRITRVFLGERGLSVREQLEHTAEAAITDLTAELSRAQAVAFRQLLEVACGPMLGR